MKNISNVTRYFIIVFSMLLVIGCSDTLNRKTTEEKKSVKSINGLSDDEIISLSQTHKNPRMKFKVMSSKFDDKAEVWSSIEKMLDGFRELDYRNLYDFIYENSIPTIQEHIKDGLFSYEELTKWYLYRILKYESNSNTSLHSIISIMPDAVKKAKYCDRMNNGKNHPIFGMPILLKDNINAMGQPTTAGAIALAGNKTYDSKIVKNLNDRGAIVLGKVNLSEWAYYFCDGCPLGYSAVGGQTLNPYGRGFFETGGSSAGSGTSMAANYAAGAVGTETAGSILSPSSQNSIVGLKPTIGVLSRTGIVPISSTLDTPGPMTRTVVDNAILLSAMYGEDDNDAVTMGVNRNDNFIADLQTIDFKSIILGANKNYLKNDDLYRETVEKLRSKGVNVVEISPSEIGLEGFVSVLDYDMQRDLPDYLANHGSNELSVNSVATIINYNEQDSVLRAPYGQGRFISSRDNTSSEKEMNEIKSRLEKDARRFFDEQFEAHSLDAILSINNYDAAHAAMAKYPCLAMPMGYSKNGEPKAMTFIGERFEETKLLGLGAWFEAEIFQRESPKGF